MKVKFFSIVLSVLIISNHYAQYVNIPDPAFANWINTNFPGCISGNQLDTTCASMLTAFALLIEDNTITNFTGLRYFKNVEMLEMNYLNSTIDISEWPPNLIFLKCSPNSHVNSIPAFPLSLQSLYMNYMDLTVLPPLPPGLLDLSVRNNLLTSLPVLPPNLRMLDTQQNQLTALPSLPSSLGYLHCSDNPIGILPLLPLDLHTIYASNCNLTVLPVLPNQLQGMDCSHNSIVSMPDLPNTMLTLRCNHNVLTSLPKLPENLGELVCHSNHLQFLPDLPPYLSGLWAFDNQIRCFSSFPISLDSVNAIGIRIYNNPATCLPNYVQHMDVPTLAMPLCLDSDPIYNPNACIGTTGISGRIYEDQNENCQFDTGESILSGVVMKIFDGNNTLHATTLSYSNGMYQFVQSQGNWRVEMDTTGLPFILQCAHPGSDSLISLQTQGQYVPEVNFSLNCRNVSDAAVQYIAPMGMIFPGQRHKVRIGLGDYLKTFGSTCSITTSGHFTIQYTGPINFEGVSGTTEMPLQNGNTLTWQVVDYSLWNPNPLYLEFETDTTAQSGDQICIDVVLVASGDYNLGNNQSSICYDVLNSYDPNFKEASPSQPEPGFNDWITYTVHFQNTGTASAIRVRIADTLSTKLDWTSLELLGASHEVRLLNTGGKVQAIFDNIMLPDSLSDPEGSQGFVQFRVKPLAALAEGDSITNKASIYFDFNTPVVTNTAKTKAMTSAGLRTIASNTFRVYPNPTNGNVQVLQNVEGGTRYEILDQFGKQIQEGKISTNNQTIDLSRLSEGMYFLRIGGSTQRIVKLK